MQVITCLTIGKLLLACQARVAPKLQAARQALQLEAGPTSVRRGRNAAICHGAVGAGGAPALGDGGNTAVSHAAGGVCAAGQGSPRLTRLTTLACGAAPTASGM